MTRGSLRLRLLLASAISVGVALILTGVGLQFLFERHVEARVALELKSHLRQLVSSIERRPDGGLTISRPLAEARFSEPLSGLYWQVSPVSNDAPLRSRSLWDSALVLPKDAIGDGEVHTHIIGGRAAHRFLLSSARSRCRCLRVTRRCARSSQLTDGR
jgi:hypothetical protein